MESDMKSGAKTSNPRSFRYDSPRSTMMMATYALRNRILRYGKRFRQYFGNTSNGGNNFKYRSTSSTTQSYPQHYNHYSIPFAIVAVVAVLLLVLIAITYLSSTVWSAITGENLVRNSPHAYLQSKWKSFKHTIDERNVSNGTGVADEQTKEEEEARAILAIAAKNESNIGDHHHDKHNDDRGSASSSVDHQMPIIALVTAAVTSKNAQNNAESGLQLEKHSLGMIYNESDRMRKESGFKQHAFNTLVSQRIGLRRELPDTRHELCHRPANEDDQRWPSIRERNGSDASPALDVSVIICFFNEDFATLQRTIFSVIERSPRDLLREIILVDDHSTDDIRSQIDRFRRYLESIGPSGGENADYLDKVRYYRVPERAGLIRARIYGTQFANGAVIVFLDSHCEVNREWLEPLLELIAQNRTTVACPVIDLIDPDTFKYSASPYVKGGFNWGLHFKWDSVPSELLDKKKDFIKPIKSPTMAGGLFAIDRKYFYELGGYDSGMDIWGGENIEMSFRVWMCGGNLKIVPCSRVGHVFRHRRPYGSPTGVDTLAYNSLRVAHVWMDDYKKYFLQSRSDLADMYYGDISDRVSLRHRLNCSSFGEYLRDIYPELLPPEQEAANRAAAAAQNDARHRMSIARQPAKVIAQFALQLAGTGYCVESQSEITYKGARLAVKRCAIGSRRQTWKTTAAADLRLGPKTCLEAAHGKSVVRLSKCHEMGGTQQWEIHLRNDTLLYNVGTGMCLAVRTDKPLDAMQDAEQSPPSSLQLIISYCNNAAVTEDEEEAANTKKKSDRKQSKSKSYLFTQWNLIAV